MRENNGFVTVVRGNRYNSDVIATPTYETFKKLSPEVPKFGEDGYNMLRDAIYSLLRHSFSKCTITAENGGGLDLGLIVETCIRYASIYYRCADDRSKEGVLQMLRSNIGDIVRNYKNERDCLADINQVSENMFNSIRDIIESGRSSD